MPSRRMIDPAFWKSESVAGLTITQRYLFIGLFSNADDQGRMQAHPALIRSLVFPFDDISLDDIKSDLEEIEHTGSIMIYQIDERECLQITGWWLYQFPQWAYPSKIPPPCGWNDRIGCRRQDRMSPEWYLLKSRVFDRDGYKCVYCGAPAEHADHIIPRSRGGKNSESNLVASCAHCNLSKINRDWLKWYASQPHYSKERQSRIEKILGRITE